MTIHTPDDILPCPNCGMDDAEKIGEWDAHIKLIEQAPHRPSLQGEATVCTECGYVWEVNKLRNQTHC